MNLNLKSLADKGSRIEQTLQLTERLPSYIHTPCQCTCVCMAEKHENYYLLTLELNAELTVTCQRCLNDFLFELKRTSKLAVCADEDSAEKLLSQYESITADRFTVDLLDLVTDEIILSTPMKHDRVAACDPDVQNFFSKK